MASKFEPGHAGSAHRGARVDHRLSELGRPGADRRREPAVVASAAAYAKCDRRLSRWEAPQPLERARLASRLGEVNAGFHQLAEGAVQLQKGLTEGAARLRAAIWLESKTGLSLTGKPGDRRHGRRPTIQWPGPRHRRGAGLGNQASFGRLALDQRTAESVDAAGSQQCFRRLRRRRRDAKPGDQPLAKNTAGHPAESGKPKSREAAGSHAARADARRRGCRTDRRRSRPCSSRGDLDLERSGGPPRPRPSLGQRPDGPGPPRAQTQLRRLYHARRPSGADRSDTGQSHVLSRRDGPGTHLAPSVE